MLSLTRWNRLEELTSLHRDLDWVFGRSWGEYPMGERRPWVPATEVTSGKDGWKVRIALSGIDPKGVHVDLNGNVLTVKGERTVEKEEGEEHISEIGYGRFERSFRLRDNVDVENVSATFEHGMLELVLPMAEAAKPRRIEISGVAPKIEKKVA